MNAVVIRNDLMSDKFPSIWLEIKSEGKPSVTLGGFYREWSHNGVKNVPLQISGIKVFANQIERAAENGKQCIVMGDANLNYKKWREEDFFYKSIAVPLLNVLDQWGLDVSDLGNTYNADHAQSNGNIAESGIDHIYTSKTL